MSAKATKTDTERLTKARTLTRAILIAALVASLAANVVAAEPTLIGAVVAAWPPVALIATVELLTKVPSSGGWRTRMRYGAGGLIAAIAAWVSYWHMVHVAGDAGEGQIAAHLIPLVVDGLVVVTSATLAEINAQLPKRVEVTSNISRSSSRKATSMATDAKAIDGASGEPTKLSAVPTAPPAANAAQGHSDGNASRSAATRDTNEAVAEYLDGHPEAKQSEIADVLGVSAKTVQRSVAWREHKASVAA